MDRYMPRWLNRLLFLLTAVLAVTGMAQMPIFKRYYIADIPGLGWLAEFYTTHKLHYLAAALFLFLVFWLGTEYLLSRRKEWRPTGFGRARIAILAVLVASGLLRTVKNLPDHGFDPMTIMAVDWIHLFAAVFLGLVAILARVGPWRRAGVYAARR